MKWYGVALAVFNGFLLGFGVAHDAVVPVLFAVVGIVCGVGLIIGEKKNL